MITELNLFINFYFWCVPFGFFFFFCNSIAYIQSVYGIGFELTTSWFYILWPNY
jgi:hypothetical protein